MPKTKKIKETKIQSKSNKKIYNKENVQKGKKATQKDKVNKIKIISNETTITPNINSTISIKKDPFNKSTDLQSDKLINIKTNTGLIPIIFLAVSLLLILTLMFNHFVKQDYKYKTINGISQSQNTDLKSKLYNYYISTDIKPLNQNEVYYKKINIETSYTDSVENNNMEQVIETFISKNSDTVIDFKIKDYTGEIIRGKNIMLKDGDRLKIYSDQRVENFGIDVLCSANTADTEKNFTNYLINQNNLLSWSDVVENIATSPYNMILMESSYKNQLDVEKSAILKILSGPSTVLETDRGYLIQANTQTQKNNSENIFNESILKAPNSINSKIEILINKNNFRLKEINTFQSKVNNDSEFIQDKASKTNKLVFEENTILPYKDDFFLKDNLLVSYSVPMEGGCFRNGESISIELDNWYKNMLKNMQNIKDEYNQKILTSDNKALQIALYKDAQRQLKQAEEVYMNQLLKLRNEGKIDDDAFNQISVNYLNFGEDEAGQLTNSNEVKLLFPNL